MHYGCSHCGRTFESALAPTQCPLCGGHGKARYKTKLPKKRVAHRQRRAVAAMKAAKLPAMDIVKFAQSEGKSISAATIREYAKQVAMNGMNNKAEERDNGT